MTGITEIVDLPDPAEQPLVHPLDVAAARPDFVRGYWTRALTTPGLSLVAAGLTWFIDENWVRPVIVFVATTLLGYLAAQFSFRRAWEYIPRGRRDLARELPFGWELTTALLFASLLSIGVFLVAHRLTDAAITDPVRAFTFGAALAATVMSVAVLLYELLRTGADRRAALLTVPPVLSLLVSVALTAPWLLGSTGVPDWATAGLGAAMMLLVGAGVVVWRLVESRRAAL